MPAMAIHAAFDILAWIAAGLAMLWAIWRLPAAASAVPSAQRLTYWLALVGGAALGAYGFGSLNLWASGQPGVARSIEGGLFGAIVAVEFFKRFAGLTARTGARYALPLAIGVAVGRVGCFLSGLEDFTHGIPTDLAIGHDFGDGILRHPVQLYESAAMALFAAFYVAALSRQNPWIAANGFYLTVGYYGAQRFLWEFLKPYGAVLGPFTIFHILSTLLVSYAIAMIATAPGQPHERPLSA